MTVGVETPLGSPSVFFCEVDSVGAVFHTAFRVDISHHRPICFHSSTLERRNRLRLGIRLRLLTQPTLSKVSQRESVTSD